MQKLITVSGFDGRRLDQLAYKSDPSALWCCTRKSRRRGRKSILPAHDECPKAEAYRNGSTLLRHAPPSSPDRQCQTVSGLSVSETKHRLELRPGLALELPLAFVTFGSLARDPDTAFVSSVFAWHRVLEMRGT